MISSLHEDPDELFFQPDVCEPDRLEALRRYDLLDRCSADTFDRLTELAAGCFGVEVSFVAFLDVDRASMCRARGLNDAESVLAGSLCTETILRGDVMTVEDLREGPWKTEEANGSEPDVSFFAGTPLITPEGHVIGTFCILDDEPRAMSKQDVRRLKGLAEMAMEKLENRRKARLHDRVDRRFEVLFEDPNVLAGVLALDGTLLEANETSLQYVDAECEDVLGMPFWETPWWPEHLRDDVQHWVERAADGEYVEYEADLTDPGGAPFRVEGVVRPVTSTDGTITSLIVSARDVTVRKQRENELRLFKEVVEQANDTILITEAEPLGAPGPRIEYANEAFEEMTGYRRDEVIGKTPRLLQGEDTDPSVLESLRGALEAGESWEGETVNYRKDGSPYQVRWSVTPVHNEDGQIGHWMSVQQDVTEKREREEELRRQRNLLDQAQRLAGAWEADLDSGTLSWSKTVYDIHEVPHGNELEIEDGIEFYAPEARPEIREAFRRCVEEGEPYDLELPLITAKGNRRWVRTVGAPAETDGGDIVKAAGAFQDITDRKERERRLEVTTRRLEAILAHTTRPMFLKDTDGKHLLVNRSFRTLFNLEEGEAIGKTNDDLFPPEVAQAVEENDRLVIENAEPVEVEECVVIDGEERTFLSSKVPLYDIGTESNPEAPVAIFGVSADMTEQKRRERELRKVERRYRAVFEDPNILVGHLETDGRVLNVNQTAMNYIDASLSDIRGEPFWAAPWWTEAQESDVQEWIQRSAAGEYVEFEVDHSEAIGEPLVVSGVVRPVTDEDGAMTSLLISGRDVSARNQDRRRLERYQEYTDRLLNASDDLFFVCDENGTLQRWNDRLVSITGYSDEELKGVNVLSFVPEEDQEKAQAAIDDVFETGRAQMETGLRPKDGSTIPYEFAANCVQHPDGDLRLVGIGRDVTGRKRREERLRGRHQKIESLYDATKRLLTAENVSTVSDRIHEVLQDVFDYALNNTGFVAGDRIVPEKTTTDSALQVPDPTPQPLEGGSVSAQALNAGETVVIPDVSALDNQVAYGALQSAAAVPIGRQGVIVIGQVHANRFDPFDLRLIEVLATYASMVFDRLTREEALREAKMEAEEASRLKSAMLANMSHEIRTPLTSIAGFAEILTENLDGQMEEFANKVYRSGVRLQKTLDSVLQLSKLEAGLSEIEREPVSLGPLVNEITEMFRPSAKSKSIVLSTDVPESTVEGVWNEGALYRIVENLVENAIKFTPEGGTVQVRVSEEGGTAVLEVEDSGIGIREEALTEIFKAFKQESEGLTREYEGSGLGLSIVKRLVEAHDGTVSVDTEKGRGSTFTVQLPCSDENVGGDTSERKGESQDGV